ncbi:MAG: glycosyltransferase family 2 protein [Alphaproteobacteria bacterium]|nr:glycosyltransferase family 2 protein [Alphaproteobacteria bacterium]
MAKTKQPLKRIACVTMARNDEFFLNRWVAYYGPLLGEENLYIYMDGLDQKAPSGAGRANVKLVEKQGIKVVDAEKRRLNYLSDRAAELFANGYELVIGCDSDECLIADPKTGMNLPEYLSSLDIKTTVSGLGIDVGQHLNKDDALDKSKKILTQRGHGLINSRFTKAGVIARPVRWGRGFHRVRGKNFHIDPNLYLFHFGNTDWDILLAKYHHPDIIARGEQKHFKRARMRVVLDITKKRAKNFDRTTKWARIIQTIFRPIYSWNKPSMLEMRWVVRIPDRFKKLA